MPTAQVLAGEVERRVGRIDAALARDIEQPALDQGQYFRPRRSAVAEHGPPRIAFGLRAHEALSSRSIDQR
jgi:hypothetical protein